MTHGTIGRGSSMAEHRVHYIGGGPSPERHRYVARLLAMLERGELVTSPGQVTHVDVFHDDWCPALSGGVCECDAVVKVRGSAGTRRPRDSRDN